MSDVSFFPISKVQAIGGPNDGYYFNGIDSAMEERDSSPMPCLYGGLVYNYNTMRVNVWRPSLSQGAAVCIANAYGNGVNTGPTTDAIVSVKMWKIGKKLLFDETPPEVQIRRGLQLLPTQFLSYYPTKPYVVGT